MLVSEGCYMSYRGDASSYETKASDFNGWVQNIVDEGRLGCRDAVIDRLVKDYDKRFLKNASPTEEHIVRLVATGLRVAMPESEVVQLVAGAFAPLPRKWANKKAKKAVDMALDGLNICSNVRLYGLEETAKRWGNAMKPKLRPRSIAKSIMSTIFGAVASMAGISRQRRRRSYNVGPVTVSAHTRRTKSGRTIHVRVHKRKR